MSDRKLTHANFYTACEALKKNRAKFLDERPTRPLAAQMLSAICGFEISPATISEIKEISGVDWEPRFQRRTAQSTEAMTQANKLRAVARQLVKICEQLGVEPMQSVRYIAKMGEFSPEAAIAESEE